MSNATLESIAGLPDVPTSAQPQPTASRFGGYGLGLFDRAKEQAAAAEEAVRAQALAAQEAVRAQAAAAQAAWEAQPAADLELDLAFEPGLVDRHASAAMTGELEKEGGVFSGWATLYWVLDAEGSNLSAFKTKEDAGEACISLMFLHIPLISLAFRSRVSHLFSR